MSDRQPPNRPDVEARATELLQSSRSRLLSWPCILIAILALLLTASAFDTFLGTFQRKGLESHTFQVSGHAMLAVEVANGSIKLQRGGENGRLTIREIARAPLFSALPVVRYTDTGAAIGATELSRSSSPFDSATVNFEITAPRSTDLHIHTDNGQIIVEGVRGSLSLSTGSGPITLKQVLLCGSSVVQSSTGSITFNGALAPHSRDELASETGSVDVTLPRDAVFHLDATSTTGTFGSSFTGMVAHPFNTIGSEIDTSTGTSPTTILTLKSNTGPIDMHYAVAGQI